MGAAEAEVVPPPSPPPLLTEAAPDAHWLLVIVAMMDEVAICEWLSLALADELR